MQLGQTLAWLRPVNYLESMRLSDDLPHPGWMILKAALFAVIAVTAGGILLAQATTWTTLFLVILVAWSAARLCYFCFYVIEKYIDPSFKFAGLGSVARHLWLNRHHRGNEPKRS